LSDFILAARDNNLPVISKIGELNRGEAARLLETGAVGVQLPRTESREQLEELIDYMKFPPVGTRANAPCYGNVDYVFPDNDAKWLRQADASVAVVAHIETQKGYENIDEIVSTPIVDMVYLGTYVLFHIHGAPRRVRPSHREERHRKSPCGVQETRRPVRHNRLRPGGRQAVGKERLQIF
jgi:2-keto-3-deoxy-L-rhamnonate aldolase RhmA